MYYRLIRYFRVPVTVFFAGLDAVMRVIYLIFGLQHQKYLKKWQKKFGPKRMAPHPPPVLPGEPNYPFSDLDTCGYFRTAIVVDYFPEEQVRKLLPNYLELAPGEGVPPGKHPVVMIFGFEEGIRPYWLWFKGPNYLEYIFAIPDTKLKRVKPTDGYDAPFFYMAQLRMNRVYPYILGRLVGYLKIMSRFTIHPFAFYMYTFWRNKPLAAFSVTPLTKLAAMPDDFEIWKERLNQPIISRLSVFGVRISGPLITHYQFEWQLANFESATASLDVPGTQLLGLPRGSYKWGPLTGTGSGALLASLPFEWVPPFSREILDDWKKSQPARAKVQAVGSAIPR